MHRLIRISVNGKETWYCGWDEDRMNQYFRTRKKLSLQKVQSIQLEIKKSLRKNPETARQTAQLLGNALKAFMAKNVPRTALSKNSTPRRIKVSEIDLTDRQFEARISDYGIKEEKFKELVQSIRTNGILNNIIVRKIPGKDKFQLISGFRRIAALEKVSKEKGRTFQEELVPARIFDNISDEEAYRISFSENLARKDLSLWEIANACRTIKEDLGDKGKSKTEIEDHLAGLLQKDSRTVRRYLRISYIEDENIRKDLHIGEISATAAENFARKEFTDDDRSALHKYFKKHPMPTRKLDKVVDNLLKLSEWAKHQPSEILEFSTADGLLRIDPPKLKARAEYLAELQGQPVQHILTHNAGQLKKPLDALRSLNGQKQLPDKLLEKSKSVEKKVAKVLNNKNFNAAVKISPAGGSKNGKIKITISAHLNKIQETLKLLLIELGDNFGQFEGLIENKSVSSVEPDQSTANGPKQKNNETPKPSKYNDWVYKTVSCCNGCSNDCIYCFAKGDAVHQKHRYGLEDWKRGEIRAHDVNRQYKCFDIPVMFPGTHDITQDNFEACRKVLYNLLLAGNRVLVVSKPQPKLITKLCDELQSHKKNMLFRFTIGSNNNDILSFWEPGAPSYGERKAALQYASETGFRTSVSIEPMLDADHIEELVDDLSPFVNHSVWIGTMNHTWYFDTDEEAGKSAAGAKRVKANRAYFGEEKVKRLAEEKARILEGQCPESLNQIYARLKDKKLMANGKPLIRWKWHIREKLGLPHPDQPEAWPED